MLDAVLGSIADKRVRTAACPALTVQGGETQKTSTDAHDRLTAL
jgi:hypothetical protein